MLSLATANLLSDRPVPYDPDADDTLLDFDPSSQSVAP